MKKWTDKEVQKLIKLSQDHSLSDIAKRMKRSVASIKHKLMHLGIDVAMEDRTDRWSFSNISEALGLGPRVVNITFVKHGLKFERTGKFCLVKEKDLLDFMKNNPNLWDATKAEYYMFCEYNWFLEKLEKDKQSSSSKEYFWTDYERQRFIILKRRGYTHKQIAEELGKTKFAVDGYSRTHPTDNKNINPWTEEEIQKLIALKHEGYTHNRIADEIGRSKKAIDMYVFKHKDLLERIG